MTWADQPLFDLPPTAGVKRAKTLRELDKEAQPSITAYRLKDRLPCEECIAVLHEAGGKGPYARSVRWKAVFKGRTLLLCNEHAELWRKDWSTK